MHILNDPIDEEFPVLTSRSNILRSANMTVLFFEFDAVIDLKRRKQYYVIFLSLC